MAKPAPTRGEDFPVGIVGAEIGRIRREIPGDEPPPLPVNAELPVVGRRVPRLDAHAKVTGAARYTVDIKLPGMLFARVLRSPHAHARVVSVNVDAAACCPGVKAVHVITERGGKALQTVRFVGAPIAAVAAVTRGAADAAVALIKVEYEALPFVTDMDEARQPYAPPVFESSSEHQASPARSPNVWGPSKDILGVGSRGDAARGFAEADIVVEGAFRTQVQTHCCLEPHAIVADWQPDRLTVYISTQNVTGIRNELAAAFGLAHENVRVLSEFTGGGFGSKLSAGDYGTIAIELSRKAGAPVALFNERRDEQMTAGNRPATWQRLRIGARRDGTLTALSVLAYGTAGTETNAGVGNIAQGLYSCANFEIAQYDVMTNAGPGCAMRAPGNVQGAFALEQMIDELAERLALDPIALRDRIDPNPARREERRRGAAACGWHARHKPGAEAGSVRRGLGMAQSFWPGIVDTTCLCEVRIGRDGTVELRSGVQDIGTGTRTVLAQVVAEELGLDAGDITVSIGDSDFPPGTSSGGSKVTGSITPAARNAAFKAMRALRAAVAAKSGAPAVSGPRLRLRDAAALLDNDIRVVSGRPPDYDDFRVARDGGGLAKSDLGGVQFAAVAVDTETGIVRVERVVAVHDCGRPINPLQLENQIHGGILMGVSYALFENRVMDRNSGDMLNADFEQYKVIGAADIPEIDVTLLENYHARSSTDACGVAEPATIAMAAAIANAVYNAIGVRIRSLPMNPTTVLAALGRIPGQDWRR